MSLILDDFEAQIILQELEKRPWPVGIPTMEYWIKQDPIGEFIDQTTQAIEYRIKIKNVWLKLKQYKEDSKLAPCSCMCHRDDFRGCMDSWGQCCELSGAKYIRSDDSVDFKRYELHKKYYEIYLEKQKNGEIFTEEELKVMDDSILELMNRIED